jgi:TRAP-type C4-dicarboxylate transport system permease large subunit
MAAWLHGAALLAAAALFGGMGLFAGGFAAFVFTALPLQEARALIRRAFPPFYLWVIFTAAIAAGAAWPVDRAACAVLAAIAVSTVPTRQMLMPAINDATDSGRRRRFAALHGLSVLITLAHIALAGWALIRLAAAPI